MLKIDISVKITVILIIFVFLSCSGKVTKETSTVLEQDKYSVTDCKSIIDSETALEWYFGDDELVQWNEQVRWVNELKSCTGRCCSKKWRTPKLKEIASLYVPNADSEIPKNTISPTVQSLNGCKIWTLWHAGTFKGPMQIIPFAAYGNEKAAGAVMFVDSFPDKRRTVAVRSLK